MKFNKMKLGTMLLTTTILGTVVSTSGVALVVAFLFVETLV